jgi:hypothetical protein
MSNLIDNVQHWRTRAEDARAIASGVRDEIARAQMLIIALGYDRFQNGRGAHEVQPAEGYVCRLR